MKKLVLGSLIALATSAFAENIPNQWAFDAEGDYSNFSLVNDKGQKLELSCENPQEGQKATGHSYRFYKNANDSVSQVTIKIDGYPYTPANYANEGKKATWNNFVKALVKGKKIEVVSGKKKLATFIVKDRGAIADIGKDCVLK